MYLWTINENGKLVNLYHESNWKFGDKKWASVDDTMQTYQYLIDDTGKSLGIKENGFE